MLTTQDNLKRVRDALVPLCERTYHYFAPSEAKAPYIVWYEWNEANALNADNHKQRQVASGYIDFFTKDEFDPTFDAIQTALEDTERLAWEWQSTQYGDPTNDDDNLIHHAWSFEVW